MNPQGTTSKRLQLRKPDRGVLTEMGVAWDRIPIQPNIGERCLEDTFPRGTVRCHATIGVLFRLVGSRWCWFHTPHLSGTPSILPPVAQWCPCIFLFWGKGSPLKSTQRMPVVFFLPWPQGHQMTPVSLGYCQDEGRHEGAQDAPRQLRGLEAGLWREEDRGGGAGHGLVSIGLESWNLTSGCWNPRTE